MFLFLSATESKELVLSSDTTIDADTPTLRQNQAKIPCRIVLNLPLSLIDSLVSPQGILHTHKRCIPQVLLSYAYVIKHDVNSTMTNKCDRAFFSFRDFGFHDFANPVVEPLVSSTSETQNVNEG
jgi:hypothetical protein